jgi:hypothetical protein
MLVAFVQQYISHLLKEIHIGLLTIQPSLPQNPSQNLAAFRILNRLEGLAETLFQLRSWGVPLSPRGGFRPRGGGIRPCAESKENVPDSP